LTKGERGIGLAKIAVIGLGYVGLTSAIGLANLGHNVYGVDIAPAKVEQIKSGALPFYEEGLEGLLEKVLVDKTFTANSSYDVVDEQIEFVFICVATPEGESGNADLSFVNSAVDMVSSKLNRNSVVVMKSTLPIGTAEKFSRKLAYRGIAVATNPEFLAEGSALQDFQKPSRIVVGAQDLETATRVMNLYEGISAPILMCGLTSAETIKHASNSFLAIKLSFVNELAALCGATGASMLEVTKGVSLDPRIGDKFLKPGPGWGGSCFPKDTSELAQTAKKFGATMLTVEAAIASNTLTKVRVIEAIETQLDGDLKGKTIAIWGLAFKANTDDTRDSPALEIVNALTKKGAHVKAFDPMVRAHPGATFLPVQSALDACVSAVALIVLTEWSEFSLIKPREVEHVMEPDPFILDTRGVLDSRAWLEVFGGYRATLS